MRIHNTNMIPNGAANLSGNVTTDAVELDHIMNYSVQVFFSGSPVGSFKLQCSNDESNPQNFTDISDSDEAITAAGDITWNASNVGYKWVRLVYTATSGTGSLDVATCNVKGF